QQDEHPPAAAVDVVQPSHGDGQIGEQQTQRAQYRKYAGCGVKYNRIEDRRHYSNSNAKKDPIPVFRPARSTAKGYIFAEASCYGLPEPHVANSVTAISVSDGCDCQQGEKPPTVRRPANRATSKP